MDVVIKMINNNKIIINIDEDDTFLKLKYILQEKTNINVESFAPTSLLIPVEIMRKLPISAEKSKINFSRNEY
jgi:hypothetical protein